VIKIDSSKSLLLENIRRWTRFVCLLPNRLDPLTCGKAFAGEQRPNQFGCGFLLLDGKGSGGIGTDEQSSSRAPKTRFAPTRIAASPGP